MLATIAVGGGIALAGASLYQRVARRKPVPLIDALYDRWGWTAPAADQMPDRADARAEITAEVTGAPAAMPATPSNAEITREVLIISLTSATAIMHLALGTPLFVLNGMGYAGLLAAHYLAPPQETYRQYTRGALFGYTGFTVVAYFAVRGAAGFTSPVGVANKLIELGLLSVLWQDGRLAQAKEASRVRILTGAEPTVQAIPVTATSPAGATGS
jgi:hypothetical protein